MDDAVDARHREEERRREGDDESWLAALDIHDRASGIEQARASREQLLAAGRRVLGAAPGYTVELMVFSGLLARAQALHEGSVVAIEHDNPHAAFTLVRAYAENAASILYVKDRPSALDRFWRHDSGVPIGRITNHARTRFDGFKEIYDQLSEYAHPAGRSVLASHRIADGDRLVQWRSAPSFKFDGDAVVACGWVVELASATSVLLVELAESWTTQRRLD